jgi:hypothetical protein
LRALSPASRSASSDRLAQRLAFETVFETEVGLTVRLDRQHFVRMTQRTRLGRLPGGLG